MSSDAERNFQESLRGFKNNSNSSGQGLTSSFASYFNSGSSASLESQSADGASSSGPLSSLLGSVRSAGQNVASSIGLAGRQDQDPELCGLTYFQRLLGFFVLFAMASVCFTVAMFSIPFMVLSPTKFATTFSLGSLLAQMSFGLLKGPRSYIKDLLSQERRLWTAAYFGSLFLTLYFSLFLRSYILTIISSIIQILALLFFFGSYVPGGTAGLSYLTGLFSRRVVGLPV